MDKAPSSSRDTTADAAAALAAMVALGREWTVGLSELQSEALLTFGQLLLKWNSHINLTGASSLDGLIADHLVDSFAIASRLGDRPPPVSVVDVGSGGGLPALPLAVLLPGATFQLIEPIAKKAAFLRTAVRTLELGGRVQVAAERLEGFLEAHPQPFDVALSRATFHPDEWLRVAAPVVRVGGTVFVLASTSTLAASAGWGPVHTVSYAANRRWLHELERST